MELQPTEKEQFLNTIKKIVLSNIDNENFSVEELARESGLSRSMLNRKLQKLTGTSPKEYITGIRLEKARELLGNELATVSEVAYQVGFKDPSYFIKVFKKHYNLSPGNAKKTYTDNQTPPSSEQQKGSSGLKDYSSFPRSLVFLLIILLVASGIFYIIRTNNPPETSLAVLPLHNLTGQAENDYFIDGIQDELIGELGRIKSIRVISRTSTLGYRNTGMLLPDIAKELGVNTIVEGSVYCLGDSLCLVIQLLDVVPKERHLLVNEYRDEIQNVLKVRNTAVKDIAQNINIKLTKDQKQLLTEPIQVDPETYKDYLRGLYNLNQGTFDAYQTGISYLQNALKKNPGDPFANGSLAMGYAMLGHGLINSKDAFKAAENAAEKALKIDPNQDDAHTALAMLYLYNFWDLPKSHEAFENALACNPNKVTAHEHYAWYHVLFNNKEKTLYHARTATVIEPLSPTLFGYLGWLNFYFEEYDEAEIAARKALELMENHPYGNVVLGWIYLHQKQYQKAIETHEKLPLDFSFFKFIMAYTYVQSGKRDKALALYNEVEAESREHWVSPFDRAMLAGMLGFHDQAFELLNEACEQKQFPTNFINVMIPGAEFFRDDPRYHDMLLKMNLPASKHVLASMNVE